MGVCDALRRAECAGANAPWEFVTRCDGQKVLGLGPGGHARRVQTGGTRWGCGPVGVCDPSWLAAGAGPAAPLAFVTRCGGRKVLALRPRRQFVTRCDWLWPVVTALEAPGLCFSIHFVQICDRGDLHPL